MNPSDHFNGKTFFLPGAHPERGFSDFLKWRFTSRPAPWPRQVTLKPQPPPPAPAGDQLVVTWLGHASFLVQTVAGNVLFDPVFSERTSPVRFAGPRRVHPVPMPPGTLPQIDAVFLSHDHYDHFDAATLRWLAERRTETTFIAPLRHRDLLHAAGARQIVELDWWESHQISDALRLTLTPTRHWSNRFGTPRNHRLWGGAWVELRIADCGLRTDPSRMSLAASKSQPDPPAGEMSALGKGPTAPIGNPHSAISNGPRRSRGLWFVGDTGYDEAMFDQIRGRCGRPDVALVPIGAYEPRWFMAPMHMNPDEAVRLHRDTEARLSIAMHWGTFQLTDEAREEPPRALEAARTAHGVAPDAFRVIAPGETVVA